jgi:uridylate kinase
MTELVYRRIVLKLSGEALQGDQGFGISAPMLASVADQLAQVHAAGVQLGIVVGGGNLFRGLAGTASGMDRVRADQMGMLATAINAIAISDALTRRHVPCEVLSAVPLGAFVQTHSHRVAMKLLGRDSVLVFAAGTGNPFFSTDTAAALRAVEIGAEVLLKATKVDGVYDRDPMVHPDARRIEHATFRQVVEQGLRVMDLTAVTLCQDNGMPIRVFDLFAEGSIMGILRGESVGTTIGGEG